MPHVQWRGPDAGHTVESMTNPQRAAGPYPGFRPGSRPDARPMPGTGSPVPTPDTDEVPVTTRVWCSVVMVPLASFMCMAQTSFFAQNFAQDSAGYTLMVLCTLLAFPAVPALGPQRIPGGDVLDRLRAGGRVPV